jgi:two-component system sensor histidine kinase YesM
MKNVKNGNLDTRFKSKHSDEIGLLGDSFNTMLDNIQQLLKKLLQTQNEKKEAEIHALQLQINPHFIYNTLESIRMTAEINDDEIVSQMIFNLSKLLHYSVQLNKQTVLVNEEIELLKNYIFLQNLRYSNKFELQLSINEKLYKMSVLKLIFQPIIENSIKYNQNYSDDKIIIKISGYLKNNIATFEITDNGIEISNDDIISLNKKINNFNPDPQNKSGVGLRNINERIILACGNKYGISIHKNTDKGLKILMMLPYNSN